MIPFKLNGSTINVPTSWEDPCFTYGQYLQIIKPDLTQREKLSVFIGEIKDNQVIVGLESLLIALSFTHKKYEPSGTLKQIGPYKLPVNGNGIFNIQLETLGQFEDMRKVMATADDITKQLQAYPKYVAIYLQKIKDGEYDPMKVPDMEKEVLTMPCYEVLTVGSFFFLKLWSLLTGTPITSPPTTQSPKKSKLVSKSSPKSSGHMRKSTGSHAR